MLQRRRNTEENGPYNSSCLFDISNAENEAEPSELPSSLYSKNDEMKTEQLEFRQSLLRSCGIGKLLLPVQTEKQCNHIYIKFVRGV